MKDYIPHFLCGTGLSGVILYFLSMFQILKYNEVLSTHLETVYSI